MKNKFRISIALVFAFSVIGASLVPLARPVYAAGANLSLPFVRRSKITCAYGCYSGHVGTDYRATTGTYVVAAKSGTVTRAENVCSCDDCCHNPWDPGYNNGYGNLVEIDHGSGYVTRYAHLSHYNFAVSVGQYVYRGQQIANADHTGESTGAHLHFEVRVSGTAVDPYAGDTHWVARDPIPMGYRDQNGTIYGPYPLDYTNIHQKWLSLDGSPGSPLGDDYVIYGPGVGATAIGRHQDFEHGYIEYLPSPGTMYYPYARTYLPDVKAIQNGWGSQFTVRDNGMPACVNVALYDDKGKVVDARTYTSVPSNAIWVSAASDMTQDWLIGNTSFAGSTMVYASADVGVVVNSYGPNNASYSYDVVAPQGTTLYLPSTHRQPDTWHWRAEIAVQNAGATTASVTVSFYSPGGSLLHQVTKSIPPGATGFYPTLDYPQLGGDYYGPAVVQATNGVPLTAVVREWNTDGYGPTLAYHGYASGATRLYLPSQHRDSWGWTSWVHVQNPTANAVQVRMYYYLPNGSLQYTAPVKTITPRGSTYFWTGDYASYLGSDYFGPAELECTSGAGVVAICNEVNVNKALSYDAFPTTGASHLSLPAQGNVNGWDTWTFVQNPNAYPVNVTVTYRDTAGTWRGSPQRTIPAHGSVYLTASSYLPGMQGSAWVESSGPVVVIVNQAGSAPGDQAMSYNGLLR